MSPAALRALLDEALALKELDRSGWRRVGLEPVESVAAHSWGVAWLALSLCPPSLDRGRVLALAVLHDLPEVRVGDLTPHDGVSSAEKHRREAEAAGDLLAPLPHLAVLWSEYAAQESPEARFVRQLDRLDMALQALRYARERGADTREFVESALTVLREPELAALVVPRPEAPASS